MAQQVVVIEPDYFSVEVTAPQTVTISNTGPQGATGPTGATGATGPQGPSGVVSVSSPITNTGTSTAANIGIDQTLLSITQSQVTNLTTDLAAKAPLASPALSGTPTAPTAAVDTNTTQIATTGYVVGQGYLKSATASSTYAPLASPTFTGDPKAPTPTSTDNDTSIATTAFVQAQKTSPALAGTPTAPTAAVNTSTTQIATTEFVDEGTNDIRQYASDKSVLENIPARVHPAENLLKQAVFWIDSNHSSASGQTITNLGWGGSTLNATAGSSGSADSNDPKFLSWDGTNYVYFPGGSANHLSIPDANNLDVNNIDIRVRIALDDWTPGASSDVVSKWNASTGSRSFRWYVGTNGRLLLDYTFDNGTTTKNAYSDVTGFTDGTRYWIRLQRNATTGTITFSWAADSEAVPTSWTNYTTGGTQDAGTITNSTADLLIGGYASGSGSSGNVTAKFYRTQVLDGIAGTPVLDVDTSLINSGSATSFTARTGQTVTINRATSGRKSVAVVHPVWLFGTDDYIEVADNDLLDFGASDSKTILVAMRTFATPTSFGAVVSKYATAGGAGWNLFFNGTTYAVGLDTRDATVTVSGYSGASSSGALSVVAGVADRSTNQTTVYMNGTAGSPTSISTVTGSSANALPVRIGATSTGANYYAGEIIAAAVFRRVLTAAEITTLSNYFQGRAV